MPGVDLDLERRLGGRADRKESRAGKDASNLIESSPCPEFL